MTANTMPAPPTGADAELIQSVASVLDERINWDAYSASEGDAKSMACAKAVLAVACPPTHRVIKATAVSDAAVIDALRNVLDVVRAVLQDDDPMQDAYDILTAWLAAQEGTAGDAGGAGGGE